MLAVDREPATQRSVLEAVVKTLGDPAMLPLKSVEYEQALTVESAAAARVCSALRGVWRSGCR